VAGADIFTAAITGNVNRIEALLKANRESVNAQDSGGNTPLMLTLWNGKADVALCLLANGASVGGKNRRGEGPMALAGNVASGDERDRIVALLLSKGADLDLFSALALRRIDLVEACLNTEPGAIERPNRRGRSPLRRAGEISKEFVDFLISRGALVDIWTAANFGDPDLVAKRVAENPGLLNAYDNTMTPLHCAAQAGHIAVAEVLLDRGAAPDPVAHDLMTPTIMALWSGQPEFSAYLVSRGANVNAIDNWSPAPWIANGLSG
jgi:ankyrin repeat protein